MSDYFKGKLVLNHSLELKRLKPGEIDLVTNNLRDFERHLQTITLSSW